MRLSRKGFRSKILAKSTILVVIVLLITIHSLIIIYDDPSAWHFYYYSNTYLISMAVLTSILLGYILFFVKKIVLNIILVIATLVMYSILTVTIHGSSIWSNSYENLFFPFITLNKIKLDPNADFELSDCEVNYFFYKIKNQYDEGRLFRGVTSIIAPNLCSRCIDSPSYSKNAESDYKRRNEIGDSNVY